MEFKKNIFYINIYYNYNTTILQQQIVYNFKNRIIKSNKMYTYLI